MRERDPTAKSKTFRTSGSFTFSSIPRLCWTSLEPQLRICSLWTIRSVMPTLHVECAPSAAVHRPSLGWMLARQIAQVTKRRAMKTFPILNNVCVKNTYIYPLVQFLQISKRHWIGNPGMSRKVPLWSRNWKIFAIEANMWVEVITAVISKKIFLTPRMNYRQPNSIASLENKAHYAVVERKHLQQGTKDK